MESIGILLRTTRGDFRPCDVDLANFNNPELEAIFQEARGATFSLEAELANRHSKTPAVPLPFPEFETRVRSRLKQIQVDGRLSARDANSVKHAVSILTTEQTDLRVGLYKQFLNDTIRHCGHGVSLLCAAGIGSSRIRDMNSQARTNLVQYFKSKRASLDCQELDDFVMQHWLPLCTG